MPTFTNKATLSYNGRTTESNTVTGNFTETLSLTKTALLGSFTAGSTVVYVVSLVNAGVTPASGLTVTDDLGGYTVGTETVYPIDYVEGSVAYYVGGVLQPAPTAEAGAPLVISGINVPANSNAILIYEAQVNENAPLSAESTITNTATVGDLTASATVSTVDEPNLTISKALCPTNVVENGALTYTFVIQNSGNTSAVATDNVVVTDIFDPILNITSVTLDGIPLELGTGYTYDQATGTFITTEGAITVPAATYTQQEDGSFVITPGVTTLVVNGTI